MSKKKTQHRDKGSGGLHKRKSDGMWVATLELPPGPDGKRRRKQAVRKSRGDAQKRLREMRSELDDTGDMSTKSTRLSEWLDTYMQDIAPLRLTPQVLYDRESVIRLFIKPLLGKKFIDRITTDDVRRLHKAVLSTPRDKKLRDKDPKTIPAGTPMLSASYARNAHNALSAALKAAQREQKLRINVCDLVDRPVAGTALDNALTQAQFKRLTKFMETEENRVMWATFLLTGARRGEVAGLEVDRIQDGLFDFSWQLKSISNIDLSKNNDYEYRHIVGKRYLVRPKTTGSIRVTPIPTSLDGLLQEYVGDRKGFVFVNSKGDPYDPSTIGRMWKKLMEAAGLPGHITLHGARHTFVDMMYNSKRAVREDVIMQLVGHSSRAMSQSYRINAELDHARTAVNELEKMSTTDADIVDVVEIA